ncbi:hypothetical protein HAX54_045939 [Datura stramonium]|uniref:Uncharacterized protein n=1 Tax=Datura stramonium TaxID=4076 RepID=A0ABS8SRE8_DATST|nr:hypothetical protein [Datura stramonium]
MTQSTSQRFDRSRTLILGKEIWTTRNTIKKSSSKERKADQTVEKSLCDQKDIQRNNQGPQNKASGALGNSLNDNLEETEKSSELLGDEAKVNRRTFEIKWRYSNGEDACNNDVERRREKERLLEANRKIEAMYNQKVLFVLKFSLY